MQPRMPSLAVLTSLIVLAASDVVIAQIMGPNCILSWDWMSNSLGQSPCIVAAYMLATCNGSVFTFDGLEPGSSYIVSGSIGDCQCNVFTYNLLSACEACQEASLTTWPEYSFNCADGLTPLTFPYPVPPGTRVPQWALVDSTLEPEDNWNATKAYTVGETPEIEPDSFIGTPTSGSDSPIPNDPPYEDSSFSGSGLNPGAIAGGTVGSVVALAAVCALLFYFLRKHQRSQVPPAAIDSGTHVALMTFYDPNDPRTFPVYQKVPASTQDAHAPVAPKDGSPNGKKLAKVQATPTPGYHGLPTV
ncbi:hypothetical protein H4582DRAFT_2189531 [Lactarius indigo]|nr:hypothetical protein H4582DRAFT_2189531 [Lactarius indigo]